MVQHLPIRPTHVRASCRGECGPQASSSQPSTTARRPRMSENTIATPVVDIAAIREQIDAGLTAVRARLDEQRAALEPLVAEEKRLVALLRTIDGPATPS